MTEKILLAMTGGCSGPGFKPCGLLEEGFPVVPLAATPAMLAIIEAVGPGSFGELWEHMCPQDPPPTGGLWVLECELENDDDGDVSDEDEDLIEVGQHIRPVLWREPFADELAALIRKQSLCADGRKPVPSGVNEWGAAEWVFQGAFV